MRVVVIGAGHMGKLHAKKVIALAQQGVAVRLSGIVDTELDRAQSLAADLGCEAATTPATFGDQIDAAIVAVPTSHHYKIVKPLLQAGIDVLVEKPIASDLQEAEELIRFAEEKSCILQVGHLEWFNSALRRIRDQVNRPRFVEAHRLGPFPKRSTDVDVVRDLMIHDLDIIQRLVGDEPERVESVGVPVLTQKPDIANTRLVFAKGCVANVTASRVSPTPMRKLRLFQSDAYFSIDFLASEAVMIRRGPLKEGSVPDIDVENLSINREDALEEELRSFVDAVESRSRPRVSGEDALRALRTALRVVDAMPPFEDFT